MNNKPWSIQVELVEGCNRMCLFCGIHGIRDGVGDYKMMPMDVAVAVANGCSAFCPTARYEFAMHGEPTVHPQYLDIISVFRSALPNAQLQMTTNGRTFMKSQEWMQVKLDELFEAGLDFVILDTYYPERDILREMAYALEQVNVLDFYSDMVPKHMSPWHNHHRKFNNAVVLMDDLLKNDGKVRSRVVYNHAGNSGMVPALDVPLDKVCTLPFREMAFRWDGSVSLCCHDWGDEYHIANVMETSVSAIWHHERFTAARRFLYHRMRAFNPCSRCDIGSGSRSGLLPKMEYPSNKDTDIVMEVLHTSPRVNGFPIKTTEKLYAV